MKRLSLETVAALQSELITQTGGLDGVRDANISMLLSIHLFILWAVNTFIPPFKQWQHILLFR
jgi:hypothetical protein